MILAVSAFIEGVAGHRGQHDPLVDGTLGLAGLHILGGKLVVLEDVLHHHLALVAGLVEVGVVGGQHLVIPRHVGVGLHLVHVEGGAVVARHALVVGQHFGRDVGTLAVGQEEVDVVEALPVPPGVYGDGGGVGRGHDVLDEHHVGSGLVVGALVRIVAVARRVHQAVAVHLQVAFGIEVALHTDFRVGLPVHEGVVARSAQQQGGRQGHEGMYLLSHSVCPLF